VGVPSQTRISVLPALAASDRSLSRLEGVTWIASSGRDPWARAQGSSRGTGGHVGGQALPKLHEMNPNPKIRSPKAAA